MVWIEISRAATRWVLSWDVPGKASIRTGISYRTRDQAEAVRGWVYKTSTPRRAEWVVLDGSEDRRARAMAQAEMSEDLAACLT